MAMFCPPGADPTAPLDLGSVGNGSGNVQSQFPNLRAQKLNLSIEDVQMTIQEGRAAGNIKLFNISGSTDLKN